MVRMTVRDGESTERRGLGSEFRVMMTVCDKDYCRVSDLFPALLFQFNNKTQFCTESLAV